MPINAPVTLSVGSLPEGFCFTNWPTLFQTFSSLLSGYVPGQYSFFNYGNTEPAADDRDNPWLRLNPDGSPDRFYVYFGGTWVSPHPIQAGGSEIRMWDGLLANLESYDGGAPGVVTDTTGPMWEEVTGMRAKFPLGVGTLPGGTVVAAGDTGGAENHTLLPKESPPHTHLLFNSDDSVGSDNRPDESDSIDYKSNRPGGSNEYHLFGQPWESKKPTVGKSSEFGGEGSPAATVAHNNMPPYKSVYFVRRTNRIFFTP